jgi:hypothetical protein
VRLGGAVKGQDGRSKEHADFVAAVQPVRARYQSDFDPKLLGYLER